MAVRDNAGVGSGASAHLEQVSRLDGVPALLAHDESAALPSCSAQVGFPGKYDALLPNDVWQKINAFFLAWMFSA